MMKGRAKWFCALAAAIAAYYWKILFTRQFTLLWAFDDANLGYAWYNFIIQNLKKGLLPVWDPYTHAGHLFQAELQTGVFYPLTWLLYLVPLDRGGMLSVQAYYYSYMLAHLLAGIFMFLLAEELGLPGIAALVAALSFSLSGMFLGPGWPNFVNSAVWLPLIALFLLRALKCGRCAKGALYACAAGLSLGLAILAGGLHVVIMDTIVVVTAAAYFAFHWEEFGEGRGGLRPFLLWSGVVVAVIGVVSFATGAVQLFPAWEYSKEALRFIGGDWPAFPSRQKLPYAALHDHLSPQVLPAFVFRSAPFLSGELRPYFGLMPLLLVVLGVWRNWNRAWVRYLAGLGLLSFFYSLGSFSLLHGLGYSLVPFLWMAREAGRFIYLVHFSAALLAGFGAQTLFAADPNGTLNPLLRNLKWLVVALSGLLVWGTLAKTPQWDEWMYLSFILCFATVGLFLYIARGHRTRVTQFLLVGLMIWDLNAFDWIIQNKIELQRGPGDQLQVAFEARRLAHFLKSQPGIFRVRMEVAGAPSIGALYGVYTTDGFTASVTRDYQSWWELPRAADILNVRYTVRTSAAPDPGPVYQDSKWKVYENPKWLPRAWVVHEVMVEPSPGAMLEKEKQDSFDPLRTAFIGSPLEIQVAPGTGGPDPVRFDECCENPLRLSVRSNAPALLVLSEVYSRRWRATVNGAPVRIHKVDGLLRGVVVPAGASTVEFRYVPTPMYAGGALSLLAFAGTLVFALVLRRKKPASAQPA